ncbi:hypothetical protein H9Q09_11905 [Aurantimonas sp. DM33-3]|uniref:hypothetical protein n=1 Tax=Aurantimonas TaxID=182269 RepID=UPI001651E89E|nr:MULTISPECIES: hypothetical protein [Aurantimonas]MBC6716912.1 hypothetical protein [Aurantimonas sp. DM33-3]MCC4298443.1 hypothetical protein [Aurantimonas coralicida]
MAEISLIFPDVRIPRRSIIGIQEELMPVGEVQFRETWNGRTIALQPSFGRKFEVVLSNDGDAVWMPSFDNLERGSQVTLYASTWWSATIPPMTMTTMLKRDAVPGTVSARDADNERLQGDVGIVGREANIYVPRSAYTTILYRPVLHCIVGDIRMSGSATGRSQSWEMVLREEMAP